MAEHEIDAARLLHMRDQILEGVHEVWLQEMTFSNPGFVHTDVRGDFLKDRSNRHKQLYGSTREYVESALLRDIDSNESDFFVAHDNSMTVMGIARARYWRSREGDHAEVRFVANADTDVRMATLALIHVVRHHVDAINTWHRMSPMHGDLFKNYGRDQDRRHFDVAYHLLKD